MDLTSSKARTLREQHAEIFASSWRKNVWPLAFTAALFVYLAYIFVYFDFAHIADRWHADRASLFALDSYAYKVHVDTRWKDTSKLQVSLEGSRWERYKNRPAWVGTTRDGSSRLDFGEDGHVLIGSDYVDMFWTGHAPIRIERPVNGKFNVVSDAPLPDWLRISKSKVDARPTKYARVQTYKKKIIIHRYFAGWEYFWFDFNSPLANYTLVEALGTLFDGPRIDPGKSNFSLIVTEFWENELWLHRDVYIALLQTIFMAVMGTLLAALLGLPLAFMAAHNVTPVAGLRFGLRRLFDMLRGIDMLIWSLIFIRAFGMGPFSGLLAIGVTDTGTLGKLMSEAIENIDKKQAEGVRSTGANRVQEHRFGILPQILPLFISQTLYYLESNTRGAVIIGAMGAGGIGLQFLGAMRTGTDWENVAYISILVLITVIAMDMGSAKLRRALIGKAH